MIGSEILGVVESDGYSVFLEGVTSLTHCFFWVLECPTTGFSPQTTLDLRVSVGKSSGRTAASTVIKPADGKWAWGLAVLGDQNPG